MIESNRTPLSLRRIRLQDGREQEILVKRDDLHPIALGGNKARKMISRLNMVKLGDDPVALVTCGGTQSNHCRVAALMAAERGWACSLVLHGAPEDLDVPRGNLLISLLAGARVCLVHPDDIASRLDEQVAELRADGYHVELIAGGGHDQQGAKAYAAAARELTQQCMEMTDAPPEIVIVASGTGTTQGGILAGLAAEDARAHVIGVSVGRSVERGVGPIEEAFAWAADGHAQCCEPIDFRDEWLDGGYGRYTQDTLSAVSRLARDTGLMADPVYVGKAANALYSLLERGEIDSSRPIVLWHTGSVPVLLGACPGDGWVLSR